MLWLATYFLARDARRTSSRQAAETAEALKISKEAADAAKSSADAAVKAQMPILLPFITDASRLLPPPDPSVALTLRIAEARDTPPKLEYMLENHGKTPAIIIELKSELLLSEELPPTPPWKHVDIRTDREVIPGETRHSTIAAIIPHSFHRAITDAEVAELKP